MELRDGMNEMKKANSKAQEKEKQNGTELMELR